MDLSAVAGFRRELLAALVLVAFGFFFFKFIYAGQKASIRSAEAGITEERAEIQRMEAETRAVETLKKSYADASRKLVRVERRLRSVKERLPGDRQISDILDDISRGDYISGVRIASVKPLPPEDRGEIIRLPFHLIVEGRYVPFGNYIEKVENLQRVMAVDNFKIEASGANSANLTTQLYLSAYVFSGAH